jgi:hypothetical protein
MQPHILALCDFLARHRAVLRQAVERVPAPLRAQAPAPGRWSVAEVLEHLAIVEARINSRLSAALASAVARGQDEPAEPFRIDEQQVARLLSRERRLPTSEAGEPRGGLEPEAAWTALEQTRAALVDLVRASESFTLRDPIGPHPIFGPLTFHEWVVFAGGHEARHAAQIAEIGNALATST